MPYEVFRKNFFAHMNELEITPGKVRLDEAIRLIVCQMSDFLVPYVISMQILLERYAYSEISGTSILI